MKNIVDKQITLRKAAAMGLVFCAQDTVDLIKNNLLSKGNAFEFARAAGFLGAKNTQHLLPHCHPVSIEAMDLTFDLLDGTNFEGVLDARERQRTGVLIRGNGSSVGRTGIEMEILTAISIAALEIYDFLKPHDKNLEISSIRLLEKTGGKTDKRNAVTAQPVCAILICSDRLSAQGDLGEQKDISGKVLKEILTGYGARPLHYKIVADEKELIQAQLRDWIAREIPFIFTCGGTGLDPCDHTVAAVRELLDKEAPGVGETIRSFGRTMVPTAILSAAIAGTASASFIVTLPGSPAGVRESLAAILPAVFHAGPMMKGTGHEN